MKKLVILLVFVSVFAQETTHAVKEGDTLWDIAGFYYQNPFLWPFIWRANLTEIADPHWIYPEQIFVIPPSPEEIITEVPEPEEPVAYVPEEVTPIPSAVEPVTEAVSVVKPEERIWSEEMIHRAGFIVDQDFPHWGQIIGSEPRGEKFITTHKLVYIDRAADVDVGDKLTVFRPGNVLTHPKTGKRLGKEILVLGKAEVIAVGEDGSRCKVIASYDIIKKGDFVTPYEPVLAPENVELIPTTREIEGFVVDVRPKQKMTPPHVFTYIDQGEDAGIAVGDVFDVYMEPEIGGKQMPDFDFASVQVISVFKEVSIGLLLAKGSHVSVHRGGKCRLASEAR